MVGNDGSKIKGIWYHNQDAQALVNWQPGKAANNKHQDPGTER